MIPNAALQKLLLALIGQYILEHPGDIFRDGAGNYWSAAELDPDDRATLARVVAREPMEGAE